MRVLADATPVSQRTGDPSSWEWCAEACMASVCDDWNLRRLVLDVVTWMKYHGMNPDHGTPIGWISTYLGAMGIPNHITNGAEAVIAGHDAGHRSICEVWSDGRGNINGSRHTTHWVQNTGDDGVNVHGQNPLGDPTFGADFVIPRGQFWSNFVGDAVQIDVIFPKDAGMGVDDMTDSDWQRVQGLINAAVAQRDEYINALEVQLVGVGLTTSAGSVGAAVPVEPGVANFHQDAVRNHQETPTQAMESFWNASKVAPLREKIKDALGTPDSLVG